VQTGDVVDRGRESIACLDELEKLRGQAQEDGGRVVTLLGNHELLNMQQHVAYAHPHEVEQYGGVEAWASMFAPGGRLWQRLTENSPVVALLNRTIFTHAGLRLEFAQAGVENINTLAMREAKLRRFTTGIFSDQGPLWTREVISSARQGSCEDLLRVLKLLDADRMVVGHTVQMDGQIHQFCEGALIAIDTGLSRDMLGHPSALEFLPDGSVLPFYAPAWGSNVLVGR
jgi:hypothetical protein